MPRWPVAAATAPVTPEPAQQLFEGDSEPDVDLPDQPAVLISPVKARAAKQGIVNKSDAEVWGLSDNEIIGE
jgi:hypothetical protein